MVRNLWTPKLLILPLLAGFVTHLCYVHEWYFGMSEVSRFFFVCIFFCFGVLVSTADRRRFQAFEAIAAIKAALISYWNVTLEIGVTAADRRKVKTRLLGVLPAVYTFLRTERAHFSADELQLVDKKIHKLTEVSEILRKHGLQSPEVSRMHQYLEHIYNSFEILLTIKQYRTPRTLRYFLQFSLILSLLLLSPEFSQLGQFGIAVSMIIGLFLACLIEIQDKIEHPFRKHPEEIKEAFLERFQTRIELFETKK